MPYTEIHLVSGEKLRADLPVTELADKLSGENVAPSGFCQIEIQGGTVMIRPETIAFLEQHGKT